MRVLPVEGPPGVEAEKTRAMEWNCEKGKEASQRKERKKGKEKGREKTHHILIRLVVTRTHTELGIRVRVHQPPHDLTLVGVSGTNLDVLLPDEYVDGERLLHRLEHRLTLLRLEETEDGVGVAVVEGDGGDLLLDEGTLSTSLVVCVE